MYLVILNVIKFFFVFFQSIYSSQKKITLPKKNMKLFVNKKKY